MESDHNIGRRQEEAKRAVTEQERTVAQSSTMPSGTQQELGKIGVLCI